MQSLQRRTRFLCLLSMFLLGQYRCCLGSSIDGRYSFSLTTFDPSGKLAQVERASVAASLGTPIVAVVVKGKGVKGKGSHHHVVLASPQILPSPLMHDDGTARFAPVAPHIAIAHSGISADGRVLVAAAQRLAVEHAYTFNEAIPIDLFLEELSLLFQEYTMKPAARPFGATLLVAYLPRDNDIDRRSIDADDDDEDDSSSSRPQLFRIDPSGSVVAFENNYAVINWKVSSDLESKLKELAATTQSDNNDNNNDATINRQSLSQILQEEITAKSPKGNKQGSTETVVSLPSTIISASLTKEEGLVVERRTLTGTL